MSFSFPFVLPLLMASSLASMSFALNWGKHNRSPLRHYSNLKKNWTWFLASRTHREQLSVNKFPVWLRNPINIRWIRTDIPQPYWKIMYSIVLETIYTNIKIKIIKLIPVLVAWTLGLSGLTILVKIFKFWYRL